MERPPNNYTIKQKHKFYLHKMQQLDVSNNLTISEIQFQSSASHKKKNIEFLRYIEAKKKELHSGRKLREQYRLLVRQYKEMIKENNRYDNNTRKI